LNDKKSQNQKSSTTARLHQPLVNNKLNGTRERIEKLRGVGVTKAKENNKGFGETLTNVDDMFKKVVLPKTN
jgi:hypothetical protein